MDDIFSVTVADSTDNLFEVIFSLLFRYGIALFKKLEEFSSFKVFHDNVDLHVFEHVTIDNFDNIWMI